jgi:hypothetical protein
MSPSLSATEEENCKEIIVLISPEI